MGIFGKGPEHKPAAPAPSSHAQPAPLPAAPIRTTVVPAPSRAGACVIGPKTTLKGEVLGDDDVIVEGTIEGHVRINRDLHVSPSGTVRASVEAQSIVVSGELIGDCAAGQRVEIQATGRLTGNVRAPRIVIAEGALFKGNSDMSTKKEERKDKAAVS